MPAINPDAPGADIAFEQSQGQFDQFDRRLERKLVIDQDLLMRSVTEATTEVFSTMLDMEVRFTGVAGHSRAPELGIISLVGITGDWGGSGVFCCSPVLANIICARMLGNEVNEDAPSIDEEVLDVVAEITNMMIGNVKNWLEPITGPLAISVPTVIHGRNFEFRNTTGLGGAALAFATGDQVLEVRISLVPTADQPGVRCRVPVLGLSHV
jgi:chemotaxis protein CheX